MAASGHLVTPRPGGGTTGPAPAPSGQQVRVRIRHYDAGMTTTAAGGGLEPRARSSGRTTGAAQPPPARPRAPWGSLSRGQVIDAAMGIVKAGGLKTMTIRSLAAELGVAPMSLYRHVRDKDDLLEEVVDRLLAAAWRPSARPEDWRRWTIEVADRLRSLLVSQPAALQVFLHHPVMSPAAVERMETTLDVLAAAGLPEADAWQAFATVQTYTVGFAALEASRAGWAPPGNVDGLVGRLATISVPEQFREGLGWILDALERRIPPGRGRRVPAAKRAAATPARSARARSTS